MKIDRRTKHYRQSKQFWYAVAGLLLAAAVIWAVTLARTPKRQSTVPTVSEEQIKRYGHTCQKIVDDVCINTKVTEKPIDEVMEEIGCSINTDICKKFAPTPTSKPRVWKYLKFVNHPNYKPVTEWLQKEFGADWVNAAEVIARESGFNERAKNKLSSACGLGQLIKANRSYECGSQDIETQLRDTQKYIINRYGSPSRALSFHDRNVWY